MLLKIKLNNFGVLLRLNNKLVFASIQGRRLVQFIYNTPETQPFVDDVIIRQYKLMRAIFYLFL